ncbi:MAG: response regulator [Agriterribacter sp.]
MSRVIIYDDDKDILEMTSTVLALEGHKTLCRENCSKLSEDITGFQPEVILMDNWLPGTRGVDAIKFIKAQPAFAHIPVIFFSANSNGEELAKEAGADWLLKKPFDMGDLLSTVKKAAQNAQTN